MKNLSADLIRKIVMVHFCVNPDQVILSGDIKPDWVGISTKSDYVGKNKKISIHAFNGKAWIELSSCIKEILILKSGEKSSIPEKCNLSECLKNKCHDAIFLVVEEYIDGINPKYSLTLHKTPDWKLYLDKVEEQDVLRWEKWLSEKDPEKFKKEFVSLLLRDGEK